MIPYVRVKSIISICNWKKNQHNIFFAMILCTRFIGFISLRSFSWKKRKKKKSKIQNRKKKRNDLVLRWVFHCSLFWTMNCHSQVSCRVVPPFTNTEATLVASKWDTYLVNGSVCWRKTGRIEWMSF